MYCVSVTCNYKFYRTTVPLIVLPCDDSDLPDQTGCFMSFFCRQCGFDQWMINLIDAPGPTLRVLCKYHYLHNVLGAKDMSDYKSM